MIDESQYGDPEDGKIDPMETRHSLNQIWEIDDHLYLMKAHARSLQGLLKKSNHKRLPEVDTMINGILDRVMQISVALELL